MLADGVTFEGPGRPTVAWLRVDGERITAIRTVFDARGPTAVEPAGVQSPRAARKARAGQKKVAPVTARE